MPVEFAERQILLEPYFLGLWLGDGDSAGPRIATTDVPVVDYLTEYADRIGLSVHRVSVKGDRCPLYGITTGRKNDRRCPQTGRMQSGANPIIEAFRFYGVESNKHIPHDFKVNSRENRLELLAGIIDSDDSLSCGGYEVISKSELLANDIVFLARSLGFAAYRSSCVKRCYNTGVDGEYHRIFISGDICLIPVRIPRKRALPRRQKKDVLVTGIRVEEAGVGEYFGFEIDGDRLFLLGDFTVTHNTTLGRFVLSEWSKRDDFIAAHVNSPVTRSQAGFLREIMGAFGLATPRNLADIESQLLTFLMEAQKNRKTVVLLLDEAHLTSPPNLDMLHRISNMQTLTEQLMQVVLLAQPNIVHKLEQRPALQSRITGGAYLGPLTYDDAIDMLRHRIGVVANEDETAFDRIFLPESHHAIYDATHGICRDLCVCADGALIDAFARRQAAVSARTIQTVSKDLRFKGWQIK